MESWEERIGAGLSWLRLDSIRNKILVLALLATLIPALSTAVLSYVQNRRALAETLEGELQGIGSQSARELDLWIKNRSYDLRVFVGSFEVTENLDRISGGGPGATDGLTRLTDYLTGVQGRFGDYAELIVIDADGRPVASSRGEVADLDLPADWLPALRSGETMLGVPSWDEALGAVAAPIAVPIEAADTRFLGVLVATLTFEALQDIFAGFAPGEGGRVDLISADGEIIVASGPISGFEAALGDETLARLAAARGGTMEYVDNDGVEMVGTLTRLDRMEWAVITHLPSSEAFAQVARLRNSTLVLVSMLLTVVGAIAYFVGLFIVRPLGRLAEGAAAVAGGDLSVDLPVTGRDEVGYLTEVFNGMVAQLRAGREQLAEANAVLRDQNAELEQLSMTDALTELFNRRYLMKEFDKEVSRAGRHERTLGVLMIDVDRFKQYNDTYGHLAGDTVLSGMGRVIKDAVREPDIPARFGGEEFIVLLPDCDLQGAIDAAERIRTRLAEEVFEGRKITVSIGAAEFPTHGESPKAVIGSADAALYEAKDSGRDRVVAAGPSSAADRKASAREKPVRRGKAVRRKKTVPKKKAAPEGKP